MFFTDRIFIKLGGLNIYWYSIMILLGILIATFIIIKEAKREKLESYFENLIFYVILFGIIGARIYYCIFYHENYNLIEVLKIWNGGLAIYGGIIAGFITVCWYAKKKHISILKTTDVLVPGLIIAQAIGRWGNFFNGEAYGPVTTAEYLHKLMIPNFVIKGMYIDGAYHEPTFLYESIWCLLGFILILVIRKMIRDKDGFITGIYFIWYGIGRYFIESLRTDSLYIGNIKVSQLVSIILVIVGISLMVYNIVNKKTIKEKEKNKWKKEK